jgi:hypothetical protein
MTFIYLHVGTEFLFFWSVWHSPIDSAGASANGTFFFWIGQYFKILGLDGIWKNTLYWIGQYFNTLHIDLYMYAKC